MLGIRRDGVDLRKKLGKSPSCWYVVMGCDASIQSRVEGVYMRVDPLMWVSYYVEPFSSIDVQGECCEPEIVKWRVGTVSLKSAIGRTRAHPGYGKSPGIRTYAELYDS